MSQPRNLPLITAMQWCLSDAGRAHSTARRLVALAVVNHMNAKGEAWPSQECLAAEIGISRRQVGTHLAALSELFDVTKRGRGRTSLYRLRSEENFTTEKRRKLPSRSEENFTREAKKTSGPIRTSPLNIPTEHPPVASRRGPKHSPEEISDVDEAFELWTQAKGRPPTWIGGKRERAQMYKARRRAGTEFMPAWERYLVDPDSFVATRQHPPGLFLTRLDQYILAKSGAAAGTRKPKSGADTPYPCQVVPAPTPTPPGRTAT